MRLFITGDTDQRFQTSSKSKQRDLKSPTKNLSAKPKMGKINYVQLVTVTVNTGKLLSNALAYSTLPQDHSIRRHSDKTRIEAILNCLAIRKEKHSQIDPFLQLV